MQLTRRVASNVIIYAFIVLVLTVILAGQILAQTITGSIYGTTSDPSGAVIQSAKITVTNTQTGEIHRASSNASGNYIFPALEPGIYKVSAQSAEFQTEIQGPVTVSANQNVHVIFSMRPGSISQTVTVSATTALVDTRESQVGETVDQKSIEDLPLNGRNAYSLVQIVPGVTNYSAAAAIGNQNGTSFSVNGNRIYENSFYLDGAFDTSVYVNGGNLLPNPDALQEFRILTSNFDAEFGRNPGGVVNALTRSGTDGYHGLLYEYLRNTVLNTANYFITGVTPLVQNQFGGNFGGPIVPNKAFFFFSYEGLRIGTPVEISSQAIVTPTPAEAEGNFSAAASKLWPKMPNGQPYSCNGVQGEICFNLLDPVAQYFQKSVPLANPTTGLTPQQSASADNSANQYMTRIDYQLTENNRISGTFFTSRGTAVNPTAGGNDILDFSGVSDKEDQTNAIVGDTWVISPNMLNSLRLFYTLNHFVIGNLFNTNTWTDAGSSIALGSPVPSSPQIVISGYWQMGLGGSGPDNLAQQSIGALDTFNLTRGNHTIKAGGSFVWNKYAETGVFLGEGKLTFTGSTTGNALADFLLGNANTFAQNNGVYHRVHAPDPALFVQDDWRVTHKLTLDLGLRWEVYAPFAGQNNEGTFVPNVQSTRFPTAPLGLLSSGDPGIPDGIKHISWTKFAPRVGFAYDLYGNGLTALSGAYGIFYDLNRETELGGLEQQPFLLSDSISKTPNLEQPYSPSPDPFPYTLTSPTFVSGATLEGLPPRDSSVPYVQEYNLTLVQQLGTQWSARIAYIGNVSRRFDLPRDENAPAYVPGASTSTAGLNARRPYEPTPNSYVFGQITEIDPIANSSYNSLQATLTRRFAHRFSLSASYVWSRNLDIADIGTGSLALVNENDPAMDKGLSALGMPQAFVASYLWSTPEIKRWGILGKQILSGWQLNGITTLDSGSAFTITSGVDSNLDGNNNDRPNQIGNPVLATGRSRAAKINEFFNTAAFAPVPAGVPYGDVSRDSLLGPGFVNTDFSTFKTFPIWKESTLQFRAEVFNLFNNVNLSNPNGQLTSPSFGKITASGSPRIAQFALRLMF